MTSGAEPPGSAQGAGPDDPPRRPEIALPADHGTQHRAARNVRAAGMAEVVGKMSTLLWTIVAARQLGESGFGAFAFALAFAQLVLALPEWSFDRVLVRRSAADPPRTPDWYTATLVAKLLGALPVFLLLLVPAVLLRDSPAAAMALLLISIALLADMWSHSIRSTGAALQQQTRVAAAVAVQRAATAALALAVLGLGGGVVALSTAFLAGSGVGLLAHVAAVRRLGVRLQPRRVNRARMRELWLESRAIGLAALVLIALFRLDTVLLGVLVDDEAVAVYSVSYRLFETVLFLTYSINAALFAVMSTARDPGRVGHIYARGVTAAAFLYLPYAAVCLIEAEAVLSLLFGERYAAQAAGALRWLAFAPLVYALSYFANSAAYALDHRRASLAAASVALLVTIPLNLVLLPLYEGTAAAAVTLLSYAVDVAVLLWILRRVVSVRAVADSLADAVLAGAALAATLALLRLPVLLELAFAAPVYLGVWAAVARLRAPQHLELVLSLLPGRRPG